MVVITVQAYKNAEVHTITEKFILGKKIKIILANIMCDVQKGLGIKMI